MKKLKAEKKEFKPRPYRVKPAEEKKVQDFYYIKSKHKESAKKQIKELLKEYNG